MTSCTIKAIDMEGQWGQNVSGPTNMLTRNYVITCRVWN